MTSEELGASVFILGYLGLLVIAVKLFGVRRVARAVAILVVVAVSVAFKTLGAMTSRSRY